MTIYFAKLMPHDHYPSCVYRIWYIRKVEAFSELSRLGKVCRILSLCTMLA